MQGNLPKYTEVLSVRDNENYPPAPVMQDTEKAYAPLEHIILVAIQVRLLIPAPESSLPFSGVTAVLAVDSVQASLCCEKHSAEQKS
jgi:hypothetical protein